MVRFQLPQLLTEVIRLDEDPVLKTGGDKVACGFESHGFRLRTFWIFDWRFLIERGRPGLCMQSAITDQKSAMTSGLMVQQEDACVASKRSGCDSRWVHCVSEQIDRSRGPAATTPGPHPGNDGSSPSGTTATYVLVEQPGVLAALSRRRSRVQIPSGTLETFWIGDC